MVEVVLLYKPNGLGAEGEFKLARSVNPATIRAMGEAALEEAREAAENLRDLDPALAESSRQDAERLARLLEMLLPGESPDPPHLRLVHQERHDD